MQSKSSRASRADHEHADGNILTADVFERCNIVRIGKDMDVSSRRPLLGDLLHFTTDKRDLADFIGNDDDAIRTGRSVSGDTFGRSAVATESAAPAAAGIRLGIRRLYKD